MTNDLHNLNLSSEQYNGSKQIRVGDGSTQPIQHFGDSSFSSHTSSFFLHDLLHIPSITKNLVSVCKFCVDNNCFFEFHDSHFSVKDKLSEKILLTGPNHNDLYVFPSALSTDASPSVQLGEHTSIANWHHRMGHPSLTLVSHVLRNHLHILHPQPRDLLSLLITLSLLSLLDIVLPLRPPLSISYVISFPQSLCGLPLLLESKLIYHDLELFMIALCYIHLENASLMDAPFSYYVASKWAEWQHAMLQEFNALTKNSTWSLVLPDD